MTAAPDPARLPEPDERFRFRWEELPAVTAALPGTGGRIRAEPEDFRVVELPAYLPEGSGSHAYARVRKRGLTTRDLVIALLAEGLSEKQIGVAGLKDKHALTEQWISVPNAHADALDALERLEGAEVLERSRHRNKLGIGHLRGNRFELRLRGVGPDGAERARAVVAELQRLGVPNYFGPQRFGRFGSNAIDGLKLLRGESVPGGHRLKRFFLSALQSLLFNAMLADRYEAGLYDEVVTGDWARKLATGGTFRVEDGAVETPRARALEITALLPLYGKKVRRSEGRAGELEDAVLERYGLRWEDFRSRRGDRRPSRVPLEDAEVEADGDDLWLRFALPKGSYATSVLREVTKEPVDAPLDEG